MNDLKKHMRQVFWVFVILFALIGIYLAKIIFLDADEIAISPYNQRINMTDSTMRRGTIYAADGQVIAHTLDTDTGYQRDYPFGNVFAHVIGYSSQGKSGVELKYNFRMQRIHFEIWARAKNVIFGDELEGNNVVTTLDPGLQELLVSNLKGQRGAAVVLEPATGKILGMASYPDFDPNTVAENWTSLAGNTEESPLLNRVTQGLYPPGSTFKVVTAAAALELDPEYANFTHICQGEIPNGDGVLRCYGGTVHGELDMASAIRVSCNTYFAMLAQEIGGDALAKTAKSFYMGESYDFALEYSKGSIAITEDSDLSELNETAIGQGRTLATPLNMALVAAAIANGGTLMRPYVVEQVLSPSGTVLNKTTPSSLGRLISTETAVNLGNMMVSVVDSGTGTNAAVSGVSIAGKTGTAQNETGQDHSWFIAYAPAEQPTVCIAIVIENTGGGSAATTFANKIFSYMLH